jgi:hypothetical protein
MQEIMVVSLLHKRSRNVFGSDGFKKIPQRFGATTIPDIRPAAYATVLFSLKPLNTFLAPHK